MRLQSQQLAAAPYNRVTVKRPNLYRWLAGKATVAGAIMQCSQKVEDVLFEQKQAVGVRLSQPDCTEYYADIIVLAEGVNAFLAQKAGIVPKPSAQAVCLYAKETVALPANTIEERLGLLAGARCHHWFDRLPNDGF